MSSVDKEISLLMAFDYGTKRIGVAIGQMVTKVARPLVTVPAKSGVPVWDKVNVLMKRWQPQALVVGIPLNMDGSEQPLTQAARAFALMLHERYKIPVYEVDERLTTVDARERLFAEGGYQALQDGQVDCVAAQIILQNWFNQLPEGQP